MVGRDLHVGDAERSEKLPDELLEVCWVESTQLLEHLGLRLGVVLRDFGLNAALQPLGQTDESLAVADKAQRLARFSARAFSWMTCA